jgi:5-methylcytosine-specific restriction protein B
MINRARLQEILIQYKQDLAAWQWEREKFKWEAVKCFQDNWDVNAQDFSEMLVRALDKTENLLVSANNFPKYKVFNCAN